MPGSYELPEFYELPYNTSGRRNGQFISSWASWVNTFICIDHHFHFRMQSIPYEFYSVFYYFIELIPSLGKHIVILANVKTNPHKKYIVKGTWG